MNNEIQLKLNDLLIAWHCWRLGYKYGRGYPPKAAGFESFVSSRQWDSVNEINERYTNSSRLEELDSWFNQMPDLYRYAVEVQARNLTSGYNVWTHPRLPKDPQERVELLCKARAVLINKLNME